MNYFEKKQWIRLIICAAVVLAVSLLLTGIIGGQHLTYSMKEETKPVELPQGDNVKNGSAKGFASEVKAAVTLEGDKITGLAVDDSGESYSSPQNPAAVTRADSVEKVIAAIIEANGTDGVDVNTGATFTCTAIVEAVNQALAGGTTQAEQAEKTVPETTEEPTKAAEMKKTPDDFQFRSEQETDYSSIQVYANAADGKITECLIESQDKEGSKDFLTDEIRAEWAKAIIENGTADTDVITGASKKFSAEAVINAVNEIQAQIDGAGLQEEPAEEPKDENTEESQDEPKEEETSGKTAEDYQYKSEQETGYSYIQVYANAEGGRITECLIESQDKEGSKDFLTDEIRNEWAKAIVENGTAETDVITSATKQFSAKAVIDAVNEIQSQIDGTGSQAEPKDEPTTEPTEEPKAESTPEPTPESTEEPKAEEPAEAGRTLYGSFMVKKETDFSVIRVYADTKGGKITSCRIESEEKSAGSDFLTDEIKDEWAKAIVENGTAETDVITGATTKLSSAAVIEAVNEILAQSGASVMPAEPAEEPKVETEAGITGSEQDTEKQIAADIIRGVAVTMGNNQDNDEVVSYLEQDPYLVNIYEGYGFAKDYGSARGHSYTLEDLSKTGRPHPKANCITCKTDDFTRLVNTEGIEVYSRPFEDVMAQMTAMGISCYTCHGDNMGADGQPTVSHSYVSTALGDAAEEIDPAILVCGQCHIEYYFTPSDSETMMPYHSSAEMVPDAILAYYDNLEMPDGSVGFSDWTQPSTGAKMLKSQHPEMETVLNSSHYAKTGMNCADCHMPTATTDDGTAYKSHYFVSPLQDETLLNNCAKCHGGTDSVISLVQSTQQKVTDRETEVGNKLSALKDTLAAAVIEEKLTGEELDSARKLYREAQWYFDFCYVENSEGAHNSALSLSCLETSEGKITEAMALLTPAE